MILKSRKTLFALMDQLVVSGCNFLIGILIARSAGVESLSYFTATMSVLYLLVTVQHSLVLSYLFTRTSGYLLIRKIKSTIAYTILIVAIAFLAMLIITFIVIVSNVSTTWLFKIYFFILLSLCYDYIRKISIFNDNVVYIFCVDILVKVIPLLSVFYGVSLDGFFLISSLLILIGITWLTRAHNFRILTIFSLSYKYKTRVLCYYFDKSKWLLMSSGVQWVTGYSYIYLSFYFVGAYLTGYILAVKNLFGFSSVLFQFYENYITPRVSSEKLESTFLKNLFITSFYNTLFIGLILLLMLLFKEDLLATVYSEDYVKYAYVLYIFSMLTFLEFFQRPMLVIIRRFNKTKLILKAYLYSFLIGLVLSYPLFYYFNETGLAVGLFIIQINIFSFYLKYCLQIYIKGVK